MIFVRIALQLGVLSPLKGHSLWKITLVLVMTTMLTHGTPLMVHGQSGTQRYIIDIEWSPDRSWIAIYFSGGMLEVQNADNGQVIFSKSIAIDVAWSPDGKALVVGNYEGDTRLEIINATTGATEHELTAKREWDTPFFSSFSWSPDSRSVAAIVTYGGGSLAESFVYIWDATSGEVLAIYPQKATLAQWNPSKTTNTIAIADELSKLPVMIIDPLDGSLIATLGEPQYTTDMAWTADGLRLAQAVSMKNEVTWEEVSMIYIWDITSGKVVSILRNPHEKAILSLDWSPTNHWLAVSNLGYGVSIWDSSTGEMIFDRLISADVIEAIKWSPDGTRLAYGGDTGRLEIMFIPEAPSVTSNEQTGGVE